MTKKPLFKVIATLITSALFGYLIYMLIDSVKTGLFFIPENTKEVVITAVALTCGPIVLSIIWSIIRRRYLWLLSILNLFVCGIIGSGMGEETTMAHAYVYGAMVLVPYLLCLVMILKEKKEYKPSTSSYSSSGYSSSGYSGSSSYGNGRTSGSMSYSEKADYINKNCLGMYSYGGIEKIENDSSLTASQKEELKMHLMIYGD